MESFKQYVDPFVEEGGGAEKAKTLETPTLMTSVATIFQAVNSMKSNSVAFAVKGARVNQEYQLWRPPTDNNCGVGGLHAQPPGTPYPLHSRSNFLAGLLAYRVAGGVHINFRDVDSGDLFVIESIDPDGIIWLARIT